MSAELTHVGGYEIRRELGRGASGTVYLGRQDSLNREVAIKVLAPELTRDPNFVERFRREAKATGQLRHPNIVEIYDAANQDGLYFIVMEYVGESDLREYLDGRRRPLEIDQALSITDQILDALAFAHRHGVIHRDVKPANVLLRDPEAREVALSDFSVAHLVEAEKLTRTGTVLGTPEYLAPEMLEGEKVNHQADLYAATLMLYEMLTAHHPFEAETTAQVIKAQLMVEPEDPRSFNLAISKELSEAILKGLSKEPGQRFEDAEALRRALGTRRAQKSGVDQFADSVAAGEVSLDQAIQVKQRVAQAIEDGYRQKIAVLALDLAGSTQLKAPGATFVADQALRDCRTLVNEALQRGQCLRHHWAGDGVLALFKDVSRATRAACEIQQKLPDLNQHHPRLSRPLEARIGVHLGELYFDPRRSVGEYSSTTIDLAQELERECPVGGVLVSPSARQELGSDFKFTPQGQNFLIGKTAPGADLPSPDPPAAPSKARGFPKSLLWVCGVLGFLMLLQGFRSPPPTSNPSRQPLPASTRTGTLNQADVEYYYLEMDQAMLQGDSSAFLERVTDDFRFTTIERQSFDRRGTRDFLQQWLARSDNGELVSNTEIVSLDGDLVRSRTELLWQESRQWFEMDVVMEGRWRQTSEGWRLADYRAVEETLSKNGEQLYHEFR